MLAAEAPELVDTLMVVSVVDRVNSSLAQALTGRSDAGDLLARAEARGLFVSHVVPGGWFEVHSLVRNSLLEALSAHSADRAAQLHARCARWFEEAGEVVLALEHWLLARQPRNALRLLAASQAELYDRGMEATVLRTVAAIPESCSNQDLESMVEFAWCHLLVSRRRFLELVDQASWLASRSLASDSARARLTMLQADAAFVRGNFAKGGALSAQALSAMGEGWWRDPLGRVGWNNVARGLALSETWDEDSDDVRAADIAMRRDPQGRAAFEGIRALGLALAGRPTDALRVAGGVRHAADVANMTILRAELALAEAFAHRELGDRSRALPELEALAGTPAETMLITRVLASVTLVEALVEAGDLVAARAAFDEAVLLHETELFDGLNWMARCGTCLALATGELKDAQHWSNRIEDSFWRAASDARVHLAQGDREGPRTRSRSRHRGVLATRSSWVCFTPGLLYHTTTRP